jgi:hypothetical protein
MRPDQWLPVQPTSPARRDWGPLGWLVLPWAGLWLTNVLLHGGRVL